jgi:hypothetical protein
MGQKMAAANRKNEVKIPGKTNPTAQYKANDAGINSMSSHSGVSWPLIQAKGMINTELLFPNSPDCRIHSCTRQLALFGPHCLAIDRPLEMASKSSFRNFRGKFMRTRPLLNLVLHDEALTRGLGDAEARILVEWLAGWAEYLIDNSADEIRAAGRVEQLRRRGRAIRSFVELWCHQQDCAAATQLAATEQFQWPLPDEADADPWELMHRILDWEEHCLHAA